MKARERESVCVCMCEYLQACRGREGREITQGIFRFYPFILSDCISGLEEIFKDLSSLSAGGIYCILCSQLAISPIAYTPHAINAAVCLLSL